MMLKAKVWFLLVVALLLPFNGALAAVGVFCHLGSAQPISAIVAPHSHDDVSHHGHAEHHGADVSVDASRELRALRTRAATPNHLTPQRPAPRA